VEGTITKETRSVQSPQERAFLVGLEVKGSRPLLPAEESLDELALLAGTAGLYVAGRACQRVTRVNPATFVGAGKVEEIFAWVEELAVDVVIFDDELSPRHQRELEKALGGDVRILDRTALILDIFAQHAQTREGALQVELAQYEYRLPRLTRQWTHLVRQAGGGSARGGVGGVGLRGPGETQLETDRREIQRRISHLKAELEAVRVHREHYRSRRARAGASVVALVGYTNAGKSTLLNALSGADVYVADQLFATLDPTTRRVALSSGRVILLSDTVGFIQKLPATVVAAFRATLEEIGEADVLLHVIDVTHPNALEQAEAVEDMLAELDVCDVPVLVALNKVDLVPDPEALRSLQEVYPQSVLVSALCGQGLDVLLQRMDALLGRELVWVRVLIPYEQGMLIARFHQVGSVHSARYVDDGVVIEGLLPARDVARFEPFGQKDLAG
jgi:GTP-binding protein HflX